MGKLVGASFLIDEGLKKKVKVKCAQKKITMTDVITVALQSFISEKEREGSKWDQ